MQDGLSKLYYPDGHLMGEIYHHEGKRDGLLISYNQFDHKETEILFKNDSVIEAYTYRSDGTKVKEDVQKLNAFIQQNEEEEY